ncbi:MAG: hypothetical protein HOV83_06260 [Catenulispora sp.]|nr:hypothetical protein [Catenulispora sp.]
MVLATACGMVVAVPMVGSSAVESRGGRSRDDEGHPGRIHEVQIATGQIESARKLDTTTARKGAIMRLREATA